MLSRSLICFAFICCAAASLLNESDKTEEKISVNAEVGNKTYLIYIYQVSQSQALNECESIGSGAKLVSIENQDDSNDIISVIRPFFPEERPQFWTSGIRTAEGPFLWKTTGNFVSFTNWAPGKPDNASTNNNCIQIANDPASQEVGSWYTVNCETKAGYVCVKNRYDM